MYSEKDATEMLLILGESKCNFSKAARIWKDRHPEKPNFSRRVFKRLKQRAENKGKLLHDYNKNRQIKRPVRDVHEASIVASAIVDPQCSLRRRAIDSGVSYYTIYSILKANNFRAYRTSSHQQLTCNDLLARHEFCRWINQQSDTFHQKILFSDECTFKSDGSMNKWNNRKWASVNPNWLIQVDHQRVWKINVWCGIVKDQIIGPFFIEGNLNAAAYSDFIRNTLGELLEDVPLQLRQEMFFQQDGCPPHTARVSRAVLNEMFPNKWIGKFGPHNWPARSPDLTVLDFYLWGRLKDLVYLTRTTTKEDMKERIVTAIRAITPEEINNAVDHFKKRTALCEELDGSHVEHLL